MYEEFVGTAMIFKEEGTVVINVVVGMCADRSLSHAEGHDLQYVCKTNKKLAMKRVVLKPKQQQQAPASSPTHTPSSPTHTPSSPAHTPSSPTHITSSPAHTPSSPTHITSSPTHTTSAEPKTTPPFIAKDH